MHLLVLGGTRFVGRAVVDHALAIGAEVTLGNRAGPPRSGTPTWKPCSVTEPSAGRRFDLAPGGWTDHAAGGQEPLSPADEARLLAGR
ncbi:hypothetical protein GCM10010172_51050 [Paractinoplanes ferrugineus]|uniref:NAD-dependent epimerase/dehydratase family protein n=1 Tax=Paractinoplanes ferrugineus TaxID=113564 RepID=A0A919JA25_9ACTN|nr:hypothetical protein [Actinoplanes ferrugineus]GIE16077.1 hypothetical protein Afe05nite_79170 [Actinoplanes ferrugineus]